MTRSIVLFALLASAAPALAQQGTAAYTVTTQIDVQLPPGMEAYADQIPTSQTVEREVLFTEAATLTRNAPRDPAAEPERRGRRMMMRAPERVVHDDLDTGARTEKTDFLDRSFLITGTAPTFAWRLTGDEATFLGYPCQKATTMRDSVAVEAWFAPGIPASVGPDGYGGLPGLILVLTEDEGKRTFVATRVSLEAPVAFSAPTEGQRVTRDEFDRIVREKIEEMGGPSGRFGGRGITIFRN